MHTTHNKKYQRGFTLIEILVVIGIIAILATIVLIAINPARHFAQARNSQRTSNVNALLNAIGQNITDNKGVFSCGSVILPTTATAVPSPITSLVSGSKKITNVAGASNVDLGCLTPTYIAAFPYDPGTAAISAGAHWTSPTDYDTEYYVIQDNSATGGGRITVFAANPETPLGQVNYISVTR